MHSCSAVSSEASTTMSLLGVLVLSVAVSELLAKPVSKDNVCDTEECRDAVEVFKSSMNTSVDPCVDFYEYACGNWKVNNPLPSTSSRWGQTSIRNKQLQKAVLDIMSAEITPEDSKPLKMSKMFYKSCIDEETLDKRGLAPLLDFINFNGGWPLIERDEWNVSKFSLQQVLGNIKSSLGVGVLLDVSIEADLKNADRRVISVDQPSFFIARDMLLSPEEFDTQIKAYRDFVREVALDMHKVINVTVPLSADYLEQRVNDIISFETKLANASSADTDNVQVDELYNPFTVKYFQKYLAPYQPSRNPVKLQWKNLLERSFKAAGTIYGHDELIVKNPDYVTHLMKILDETPIETVANYVQWRVISILVSETTTKMRDIQFNFDKATLGLKKQKAIHNKCSDLGLSSTYFPLGYAVGSKYIQDKFPAEAKQDVADMVKYLRNAFGELLREDDWLDAATKHKAQEKINTMKQFIGYPDWLRNDTAVEEYFEGLDFEEGKHFENQIRLISWWVQKDAQELRKPVDRDEFKIHPVVLNAMYTPEANSITFPAAILEPTFYRHNGPASINFGAIGVVIGHEITHGFDLRGSQYDERGNAFNWWSPKDKDIFNRKARSIVDQYSAFKTPVGRVNGELTVTENIADNGGLRQAHRSYKDWLAHRGIEEEPRLAGLEHLSHDQLFFLGYANLWCQNERPEALQMLLMSDEHSPPKFRTLGPFMNSKVFAEAWQCPVGSPMNPGKKNVLW